MNDCQYPFISDVINVFATNMVIKTINIVRDDQDKFHFQTVYDLSNMEDHPDNNVHALNIFGEAMVHDYNNFHFTPR